MPHAIQEVKIDPAGEAVVKGSGEHLEIFRLPPVLGLHRRPMPTANHRAIRFLEEGKKLIKSRRRLPASYRHDVNLTMFPQQVATLSVKVTANVMLFMK